MRSLRVPLGCLLCVACLVVSPEGAVASVVTVDPQTNAVQKDGTPVQGSPFPSNWDAIQAAVQSANLSGGDTVQLLAGTFSLEKAPTGDKVRIASPYWALDFLRRTVWELPDYDTGEYLLWEPILVDRPVTIRGVKSGESYLTTLQGDNVFRLGGFIVHNNARVRFEALRFYMLQSPIILFAPSDVVDCYFDRTALAIYHYLDDRLVFPSIAKGRTEPYEQSLVAYCTFDNLVMEAATLASGATFWRNKVLRTAPEYPAYTDDAVSVWAFLEVAATYDTWEGTRIFQTVSGSPRQRYLAEIHGSENLIDNTGGDFGQGNSMAVFTGGLTERVRNLSWNRNYHKNSRAFQAEFILLNAPYYWGPAFFDLFPALTDPPVSVVEGAQFHDNTFEKTAGVPGQGVVGLVSTSARGNSQNVSIQRNRLVHVYDPDPFIDTWGFYVSNRCLKLPFATGCGETSKCLVAFNDFSDSDMSIGTPAVVLDSPWHPPVNCIVQQPPSLWVDPTASVYDYIWDFGDNKILGGEGQGPKPVYREPLRWLDEPRVSFRGRIPSRP